MNHPYVPIHEDILNTPSALEKYEIIGIIEAVVPNGSFPQMYSNPIYIFIIIT